VFKAPYQQFRMLIIISVSILISMLTLFFVRYVISVVIEGNRWTDFISRESFSFYLTGLIITLIVSAGIHAFYFYKALQEKKVKEQQIVAGTEKAKYESLKSQLDPHFLFNSLNVLTSLIEENPDTAQDFTTALSKVYRYVLEQKDKDLVSVAEELRFAKTYMSLLKMRFENALEFELPSQFLNPEAKVVPLSLQILLENCIKHNVVSEDKPLFITIREVDNSLVVTNNFQQKQTFNSSSGVGLKNIKERYNILTHRNVVIRQSHKEFSVQIPLLTKQSSIMRTDQKVPSTNSNYLRARKRLDKLKEFYGSLLAYVIVIPFLAFINYRTFWGVQWFWFAAFGWGIGLTFQAFEVFGRSKYFGKSWEDKKLREFMKEEDQQRWE
jgi:sensor histidine kinase YesM